MGNWQNKVALVTGGSAGLGRAIAEALARRGAKVAIAARGGDALRATAAAIQARAEVLSIEADVTRQEDVERMVGEATARFGRLDMLVNCAGRSARGAAIDVSPEEFQAFWDVNFLAAVRCARAAMPHLLERGGHLVNIGSLASKVAARHLGPYPATKFPLAAYSQQLRLELEPKGLHVLLVCPGPIARDETGDSAATRYEAKNVPREALRPGGGAKVRAIDPKLLTEKILQACQKRKPELVVPGRARILFALSQLSPRLGDYLLKRLTGG